MKTTIIAACATIAQPLAALNVYGANASPSPSPSPSPSSMSAPQNGAWLDITLKLLDWPFLLLVVVLVIVFLFRRQLTALFNRGDILISWGEGRSIRLRELADKIDQEIDPLRDDVEALKETAPKAHLQA